MSVTKQILEEQMNRRTALASFAMTGLFMTSTLTKFSFAQGRTNDGGSPCIDLPALFDQVFTDGKGFDQGEVPETSTTVFVLFDPQCPDCIKFWDLSNTFKTQVRFIWLPVAVLNSRSEPQGALILSATHPADMMARQVELFNTPSRGLETTGVSISDSAREDVWQNARIFRRAGGKSVPFLISQDRTNQIIGSADIESLESLETFLNLTR
jgi:thiol:disulfide interchange protein DsbG